MKLINKMSSPPQSPRSPRSSVEDNVEKYKKLTEESLREILNGEFSGRQRMEKQWRFYFHWDKLQTALDELYNFKLKSISDQNSTEALEIKVEKYKDQIYWIEQILSCNPFEDDTIFSEKYNLAQTALKKAEEGMTHFDWKFAKIF